jgi:hypothetical protein
MASPQAPVSDAPGSPEAPSAPPAFCNSGMEISVRDKHGYRYYTFRLRDMHVEATAAAVAYSDQRGAYVEEPAFHFPEINHHTVEQMETLVECLQAAIRVVRQTQETAMDRAYAIRAAVKPSKAADMATTEAVDLCNIATENAKKRGRIHE